MLLGAPFTVRAQQGCELSPGSPEVQLASISTTLDEADQADDGFSWSRFGIGLLKGAVTGLVVGAAATVVVATAPAWLTATLAVGAVGVAAYGIYSVTQNWDQMSGGDKSEFAGNLIGGLVGGGVGSRAATGVIQGIRAGQVAAAGGADSFLAARGVTTNVPGRTFGPQTGEVLVHLTDEANAAAINGSGMLFGRGGVFALDAGAVPATGAGRTAATLVGGKTLNHGVLIPSRTAYLFRRPVGWGPLSLYRRAMGVRAAPPGTLTSEGEFIFGKVFDPVTNAFRNITPVELATSRMTQFMLDYGVDATIYTGTGIYAYDVAKSVEIEADGVRQLGQH